MEEAMARTFGDVRTIDESLALIEPFLAVKLVGASVASDST
jgi:hypothetical protein